MIKQEDKYFNPFLDYYLSEIKEEKNAFKIQIPDKNSNFKMPDYLVIGKDQKYNFLVEVKQIINREDREAWAHYGYNARRQEKILNKSLSKDISGIYMLSVPRNYKVNKKEAEKSSKDILKAAKENFEKIKLLDKYEVELKRVSEKGKGIYLSTSSGGFIDPAGTIFQNIKDKIQTADKQLAQSSEIEISNKILLLVNQYEFASPDEVVKALSYDYENLLNLKEINEIYYQWWSPDGKTANHEKLFTREFLTGFDNKNLESNPENILLFEKWFISLEKINDSKKDKLFYSLQKILKQFSAHKIFSNKWAREEMTRLGIWLIEQNRISDAEWLIERFLDDPDPEEPKAYKGQPEFNYHKKIMDGKDSGIITGVKCHLVWTIQKLAMKKEGIDSAFKYSIRLLETNNYYVIQQAIIPLIEITARRQWLSAENQVKLKKLLFELLEKYGKYSAIAKYLAHAFYYLKDISANDAEKIVTQLNSKNNDDLAVLLIYYAIFRPYHFRDNKTLEIKNYDPTNIQELLKEKIKSKKKDDQDVVGTIAWNFWKITTDEPEQFDKIEDYINLFFKMSYSRNTYDDLMRIIEDNIERRPKECLIWLDDLLNIVKNYNKTTKGQGAGGELWVAIPHTIYWLAENDSKKLLEVVKILKEFWMKNFYIGEIKNIFESYRFIKNKKTKLETIIEFKKLYAKMKKENQKLVEPDWSL